MKTVEWYFDFVSPFSYLACEHLPLVSAQAQVRYHPVLFAALLDHWKTQGPAEIPPMRTFTYRFIVWQARRHGISLRLPGAHPFNPLPLLRLSLALGNDPAAVREIFRYVWRDGHLPTDETPFTALIERLGDVETPTRLRSPEVKQQLRENTDQAIRAGVFGVPTFAVDGELFWGFDAIDFLRGYLNQPGLLDDPQMQLIDTLPVGAARR